MCERERDREGGERQRGRRETEREERDREGGERQRGRRETEREEREKRRERKKGRERSQMRMKENCLNMGRASLSLSLSEKKNS